MREAKPFNVKMLAHSGTMTTARQGQRSWRIAGPVSALVIAAFLLWVGGVAIGVW